MKKYFLTVLLTAAVLAGCEGAQNSQTETTTAAIETTAAEMEESTVPAESESEAETADASSEKPEAGTWEGSVYTDSLAGIHYTLPEGWTAADDAMIESAFGSPETDEGIYTMMALNASTGENVIMMYENLDETAGILAGITTEASYFDVIEKQLGEQGLTVQGEPQEYSIGENTYLCEAASMESQGMTIYQYYMIRKIDSHMFCIIFSMQEGSTMEGCLATLS